MTLRSPDPVQQHLQIGIDVGYREGYLKGLETALQVVAERNEDLNMLEIWGAVKKLRQDWEAEKAGLKKGDT